MYEELWWWWWWWRMWCPLCRVRGFGSTTNQKIDMSIKYARLWIYSLARLSLYVPLYIFCCVSIIIRLSLSYLCITLVFCCCCYFVMICPACCIFTCVHRLSVRSHPLTHSPSLLVIVFVSKICIRSVLNLLRLAAAAYFTLYLLTNHDH